MNWELRIVSVQIETDAMDFSSVHVERFQMKQPRRFFVIQVLMRLIVPTFLIERVHFWVSSADNQENEKYLPFYFLSVQGCYIALRNTSFVDPEILHTRYTEVVYNVWHLSKAG